MNWFEPTVTATSLPVPPGNAVPSTRPTKSITTRSPFSTLAPSAFAAYGLFCSAICLSASSTSLSATSATSFSSLMVPKSASVIAGSTSNDSV